MAHACTHTWLILILSCHAVLCRSRSRGPTGVRDDTIGVCGIDPGNRMAWFHSIRREDVDRDCLSEFLWWCITSWSCVCVSCGFACMQFCSNVFFGDLVCDVRASVPGKGCCVSLQISICCILLLTARITFHGHTVHFEIKAFFISFLDETIIGHGIMIKQADLTFRSINLSREFSC